jgi:integrase/recombinase XerD
MGEVTLRKALDDYKTVYMPYRNFAERTREEYLNDLEALLGYLEMVGTIHVKALGLPIIERYVANLEQKGFASLTRKRKVVAIRSFLSYLYEDGCLNTNIAKKIVLPFAESTMPYVLTQTECDQIRNACAERPRDRAIIELLLQTGIKLSELIHLTLKDIELETPEKTDWNNNGYVRILGSRGKKERAIPINTKACTALKRYLDARKDAGNNIIFLTRFGEPIGERGVQKMLRTYLKKIGLERASVHTLRHTFGIHHAVKGTTAKTIQEVMGHKDLRSTSRYFSMAQEMIKKELEDHAL